MSPSAPTLDWTFTMNRLLSTCLAVAALSAVPAHAETSVGVSIDISQPGVYGRIDIGNAPPPPVVYAEPILVMPGRVVERRPIYLHVPPGHQKNWRKHCARYDACGQPVYFVREEWVMERRGDGHHDRKDHHKDKGRGHRDD